MPVQIPQNSENEKARKFIVVGANCGNICTSVGWDRVHLHNLVDYDVVILIARNFVAGILSLDIVKVNVVQQQIRRMLKSGGALIVVTERMEKANLKWSDSDSSEASIDLNAFLPFNVILHAESGTTIEKKTGLEFSPYLSNLKKWNFWIEPPDGADSTPYLSNREGVPLAGYFLVNGIGMEVLPVIPDFETDEIARELLRSQGLMTDETPPPKWTSDLSVPGVSNIDIKIAECESRITGAQSDLDGLVTTRASLDRYKKLLYATGDDLEFIVADLMETLGATLLTERCGVEDLLMEIGEQTCAVEIHGTEGTLKLLKLRQLFNHAFDVEIKLGKRPKGILIANPFRKVAPDKRNSMKSPEFSPDTVERAAEMKISIVSGRWLFKQYCDFLENKLSGDSILQEIVDTDGLLHLPTEPETDG